MDIREIPVKSKTGEHEALTEVVAIERNIGKRFAVVSIEKYRQNLAITLDAQQMLALAAELTLQAALMQKGA